MLKNLKFILTKSEKIKLVFLALGSILLSLSEVLSIGILIPIIWLFVNPEKIHNYLILNKLYLLSGVKDDTSFLIILTLFAIILFFLKTMYSIFMLFCQQNFITKVYNRLTANVLDYYVNKEYAFHLANNSSVLFKNMSAEVSQFTAYFLAPIIAISSECIIVSGIVIFLYFSYPAVTIALFFISGGLLATTNFILKKKINSYAVGRNIYSSQFYKFSLEALHAVKEIQVFNAQKTFVGRLEKIVKKYNDNFVKFNIANSLPRYILEMVFFFSILTIIIFTVYTNKDYKEIIPMMTIVGVVALRLLPSISRITANINAFHFSFNSTDIVYDIVKGYKIRVKNASSLVSVGLNDADGKSLRAVNITFSYAEDKNAIFKDFSLIAPLNKTTALIGETGSGKSTLIDIIMGLLTPQRGDIYYGETRIAPENILAYRKKIGYVPQNIFLFDDTICSNIAFGIPKEKIDYEMLNYVIRITQLESFINNLPDGINSQIGERGIRISGGQRQRIGIARALYRNPEIIIFDEATSALDVCTEARLYSALRPLGKTIIVVTHRLSTIESADIIYVLENGKIAQQGTFAQLRIDSRILADNGKQDEKILSEE